MDELFDFIRSLKNINNYDDMIAYHNIGLNMIKNIKIYGAVIKISASYFSILVDDICLSIYFEQFEIIVNNKQIIIMAYDKLVAICETISNIEYAAKGYPISYDIEESTKMSVSDGIDWLLNQKPTKSAIN